MDQEIKKKISAYFIIFIMIFSSVGFALYFAAPSKEEKKVVDKNVNIENAIPLTFEGETEVTIKEFTNTLMLIGDTNHGIINDIDIEIKRCKNVVTVNSQYMINNNPNISSSYIYRADITVSKNIKDMNLDALKECAKKYLQNVQIYPYAFAELGMVKNLENKDLNVKKEYDFANMPISVLVGSETIPGDKIEAKIVATFLNNAPTKVIAYEMRNLSIMRILNFPINAQFQWKKSKITVDLNADLNLFDLNLDYDWKHNQVWSVDLNYINIGDDLNRLKISLKDYNAKINGYWEGSIVVSKIIDSDNNQEIDYNKEVPVFIEYDENIDLNKPLTFNIMALLQRNKPLQVSATLKKEGD